MSSGNLPYLTLVPSGDGMKLSRLEPRGDFPLMNCCICGLSSELVLGVCVNKNGCSTKIQNSKQYSECSCC